MIRTLDCVDGKAHMPVARTIVREDEESRSIAFCRFCSFYIETPTANPGLLTRWWTLGMLIHEVPW